jgi:hypothetical protein
MVARGREYIDSVPDVLYRDRRAWPALNTLHSDKPRHTTYFLTHIGLLHIQWSDPRPMQT